MKKYFIFQFAQFGDCLYATIIAKQIKHDDPNSHITWGISTKHKSILLGNPHVDEVMDLGIDPATMTQEDLDAMHVKIKTIASSNEFDEFIHLQIHDKNLAEFCTTLRQTVFKVCGRAITVDVRPVVNLTPQEIANVKRFTEANHLSSFKHVILFECAPTASQSKVNVEFAFEVARKLTAKEREICFILTSPNRLSSSGDQIIDASSLSFRENLELINNCTLLIGSSSGITWLATAESARKIPMIQLLSKHAPIFAGVNFDFHIQQLDNRHIIEFTDFTVDDVIECIKSVFQNGVESAKLEWNQDYRPSYFNLECNLSRLVWLDYPVKQLYDYADRFISENAKYGNILVIGRFQITRRIIFDYLRRVIFKMKMGLKPIKTMIGA